MKEKKCCKCGEVKGVELFSKDKRLKTGVRSYCKKCGSKYYEANREKVISRMKKYYEDNREKVISRTNKYKARRHKNDPAFRILSNLRSRLNASITKGCKSASTIELLGASPEFVRKHIESKWTEGMSWDTYGPTGWHIDHIKPCASFDLTDPEEQRKCFHYSNLQPLWWRDNLDKSDKYDGPDNIAWGT